MFESICGCIYLCLSVHVSVYLCVFVSGADSVVGKLNPDRLHRRRDAETYVLVVIVVLLILVVIVVILVVSNKG